jgi:hypothetical protein
MPVAHWWVSPGKERSACGAGHSEHRNHEQLSLMLTPLALPWPIFPSLRISIWGVPGDRRPSVTPSVLRVPCH